MSRPKGEHYSFSRHEGAKAIGCNVSEDLHTRISSLCNILEMPRSSLIRYLISRGVDELEQKLVERVDSLEKTNG